MQSSQDRNDDNGARSLDRLMPDGRPKKMQRTTGQHDDISRLPVTRAS